MLSCCGKICYTEKGFMIRKQIDSILGVLFGNFLLAVSVVYFVLPYNILSGGCAGLAVIFQVLFDWNPTTVIDILVIVFFISGAIILGKEFAAKTLLSSISYPIFIELLERLHFKLEIEPLMACIFGGLIAGIGIGIAFRHNASTGGTDVIPLSINKFTGWPVDKLVFLTDAFCAGAGILTYGVADLLYGIVYIYLSSYAIGYVMVPKGDNAVAIYIITDKIAEVKNFIMTDINRGVTVLNGKGGYTSADKEILLTVVSKSEYVTLSRFMDKCDPRAFIIVSDAKEIKGEGFTYEYRV